MYCQMLCRNRCVVKCTQVFSSCSGSSPPTSIPSAHKPLPQRQLCLFLVHVLCDGGHPQCRWNKWQEGNLVISLHEMQTRKSALLGTGLHQVVASWWRYNGQMRKTCNLFCEKGVIYSCLVGKSVKASTQIARCVNDLSLFVQNGPILQKGMLDN